MRSFALRVMGLGSHEAWSRFGSRWWAIGFDKMSVDFVIM